MSWTDLICRGAPDSRRPGRVRDAPRAAPGLARAAHELQAERALALGFLGPWDARLLVWKRRRSRPRQHNGRVGRRTGRVLGGLPTGTHWHRYAATNPVWAVLRKRAGRLDPVHTDSSPERTRPEVSTGDGTVQTPTRGVCAELGTCTGRDRDARRVKRRRTAQSERPPGECSAE